MKKNILITGVPGSGKTTLIKKIHENLDVPKAGFYTEEICEGGTRKGFALVSLEGMRSTLAHIGVTSPFRVGKYGVDIKRFDEFLAKIDFLDPSKNLIIIDEIGKMECFSTIFTFLLKKILDSPIPVLATISLRGEDIIADIKKRRDVYLITLTPRNRDALVKEVLDILSPIIRRTRYNEGY